ncbi:hypothetical protein DJ94_4991 [Bacillus pseudomycoides]|nr:hypothetical protein DJ94_4991 [Bacillus pseudomycoides]
MKLTFFLFIESAIKRKNGKNNQKNLFKIKMVW